MTLFRPAVIEAQRRRVYGDVTLHQPARLAAFALVGIIGVASATAYLAIGTFARKETVAGWVVPAGDLASVSAPRGGLVAAISVAQGDYVRRGQTVIVLDMGAQGGSVWGNRVPVSSTLLIAPLDGQVASMTARVGVEAFPNLPLLTKPPKNSQMTYQFGYCIRPHKNAVHPQIATLQIFTSCVNHWDVQISRAPHWSGNHAWSSR